MRSIWNGAIGFGLVNIPVKLFSAVQQSNLDFDMLDEKDHAKNKIPQGKRTFAKRGSIDKIVKGYFLKDRYVILDKHDFEEASPEKNKTIEIENFVDINQINPIYYETSYYSQPEKQGKKAYALLLKTLIKSNKAGLARFVLRSSENLCIIHPMDNVIVITKIRFAQEVRKTADLVIPDDVTVTKKEMDVGLALIKQYSGDFDLSNYKDEYSAELLKIIKAKAKGKRATVKKLNTQKSS